MFSYEKSVAKLGKAKFDRFLTPDMASKNDVRHDIE